MCPYPAPSLDRRRKDIVCFRCGKQGHVQIDCQKIEARRSDNNATSKSARQANTTAQTRTANSSAAPTSKPFDPGKVAACVAKENSESLAIVSGDTCNPSIGSGTDSAMTALIMSNSPSISVSDQLPRTWDDFLIAMHADSSSRRSVFCCIANLRDECKCGLSDSGSCRNPPSENLYKLLSLEVPLKPPGANVVVPRKGKALDLCGWQIFMLKIAGKIFSN